MACTHKNGDVGDSGMVYQFEFTTLFAIHSDHSDHSDPLFLPQGILSGCRWGQWTLQDHPATSLRCRQPRDCSCLVSSRVHCVSQKHRKVMERAKGMRSLGPIPDLWASLSMGFLKWGYPKFIVHFIFWKKTWNKLSSYWGSPMESWKPPCQVCYDPGFHVVKAMQKVPLPYRWARHPVVRVGKKGTGEVFSVDISGIWKSHDISSACPTWNYIVNICEYSSILDHIGAYSDISSRAGGQSSHEKWWHPLTGQLPPYPTASTSHSPAYSIIVL